MEKETMKKFRWFWAWEDEKEERWLEAMSRKGWHLQAIGFVGTYIFRKGQPREYSYSLDFHTGTNKSLEEYKQICRDAGWEELGRMGSWFYFRKECRDGEKPEFFSDRDSKIQKYRRLIVFLVILLPLMLNGTRIIFQHEASWLLTAVGILYVGFLLVWIWAIVRLLRRINRLKKS
jgi:hypothetical protein